MEQVKADMIPSTTQALSFTAGVDGGEAKRTTENAAFKIISSPYIRRLEITCDAISRVLNASDDIDRKLVDLVYWRREYTVEGAGMRIGISRSGAYKRINRILGAIAYELGYISTL